MHVTRDLLEKYDRPGPRYTSYPTALEFHEEFGPDDYTAHLQRAALVEDPLSLYMHLPFCRSRCLYCACNVVIDPHNKVAPSYLKALQTELSMVAEHLSHRPLAQLHLGGGTPTYYAPDEISALLGHVRNHFTFTSTAELAAEIDPRVTTREHLEILREHGFNRLSLGVQDFDEVVQHTIGRIQSFEQTMAVIEDARELGIDSLNLDLIYGLPHQTVDSFQKTLEYVLAIRPDRLAIYGFAYVPWRMAHQKKLPKRAMPDANERMELLVSISRVLTEAGYESIGMDHFALPDSDLCQGRREGRLTRNFMGYTTSRAPDLIGVGLSAIGEVDGAFAQNHKLLHRYMDAIERSEFPVERGLTRSSDDELRAFVIRELMCNLTVARDELGERFGAPALRLWESVQPELREMADQDLLELGPSSIQLTPLGQLFVRNVAMIFDAYLTEQLAGARPVFSRTV